MSNIMKPPPREYQAPSSPYDAPSPGSNQPQMSPYVWEWITVGIVALVSILGCALLSYHRATSCHATDQLHASHVVQ